jgi:hypothetical protein
MHRSQPTSFPGKSATNLVRKIVEKVRKSKDAAAIVRATTAETRGKSVRHVPTLRNVATQRWLSAGETFRRFLYNFVGLKGYYVRKLKDFTEVERKKRDIEELYSLMSPMASIIGGAQKLDVPMGPSIWLRLVTLRCDQLNPAQKLQILNPAKSSYGDRSSTAPRYRSHQELLPTTQMTREKLAQSVDKRFFIKRYEFKEKTSVSLLLEAAFFLNPFCRNLTPLKKVMQIVFEKERWQERFEAVVEEVKDYLVSLMIIIVERLQELEKLDEVQPNTTDSASNVQVDLMSPREELEKYSKYAVPDDIMERLALETQRFSEGATLLKFWSKKTTQSALPILSVLAQSLLALPPTAAAQERDFCISGQLLSPTRPSLGARAVDRIMFLHANYNHIEINDVPQLTAQQVLDIHVEYKRHAKEAEHYSVFEKDLLEGVFDDDEHLLPSSSLHVGTMRRRTSQQLPPCLRLRVNLNRICWRLLPVSSMTSAVAAQQQATSAAAHGKGL